MAVDRAQIPGWVAPYIGLPFRAHGRDRRGVDCWGLARLVLQERHGLDLPSYAAGYEGAGVADLDDIARLIDGHRRDWIPIAEAPDRKSAAALGAERGGDVLLLRLWGRPSHVGVVVAPGWMLHVEEKLDSATEIYDGPVWRHRVAGVYRHALLA